MAWSGRRLVACISRQGADGDSETACGSGQHRGRRPRAGRAGGMKLGRRDYEMMIPVLTLALMTIGAFAVYSASNAGGGSHFYRQLIYMGIGLGVGIVIALVPDRLTFAFSYVAYTVALMLLALVLLVGTGPTGRWLGVGAFHIQPSELAKPATVLALARFLSDQRNVLTKPMNVLSMVIIAAIPFGLILIEPDMGTSLVIPVITGAMAFYAGIPLLIVVLVVSPVAVMVASINPYALVIVIGALILFAYFTGVRMPLALLWGAAMGGIGYLTPKLWMQLQPYQRDRLTTFLSPESDPLGAGYQMIQSKVAIGSGEFWGRGFLQGSQTQRGFLPEQHTDFIFSVIGEELGFAGAALVLILFWLLILRMLYMARKVHNPFARLTIIGVASVIGFQVLVNVGMTVGLMPITGLPLPLLSYGGSSMLTTMMMIGLATGMSSRWKQRG
ncbi:rod shape-determining protein RodA [bacterium]|nr:rod shape-determining protein RodA [bacterium]